MIDHLTITVSNLEHALAFYRQALAPLGYDVLRQGEGYCGMGPTAENKKWIGTIWLSEGTPPSGPTHIAFRAETHAIVDQFHAAALAAGGHDNGKPGLRPEYHDMYYGAFILDQDGNNIEAVCHI